MDKPSFNIRRAQMEDCPQMLELIRELAVFERAPDEVTVTLEHFEESGFGEKPVWWAFVACMAEEQEAQIESGAMETGAEVIQGPVFTRLVSGAETETSAAITAHASGEGSGSAFIQLDEPVEPAIPGPVLEALPLMQKGLQTCEKVIGFALYYIRYSTWKGQRMYLEDIIVTDGWRGKGVGTALMDALFGAAVAEGFHGISWQVLGWNEGAMKFYERYGVRFDREWVNVAVDV